MKLKTGAASTYTSVGRFPLAQLLRGEEGSPPPGTFCPGGVQKELPKAIPSAPGLGTGICPPPPLGWLRLLSVGQLAVSPKGWGGPGEPAENWGGGY